MKKINLEIVDDIKQIHDEQTSYLKKRKPELSEKAIEERAFLTGLLIHQADDLATLSKKRKKEIENTIVEFKSGEKTTVGKIYKIVSSLKQNHDSQFSPKTNPFFREFYRLMGWQNMDYSSYVKPREVADFINKVIYARFKPDVLHSLHVLNPYVGFCVRMHKNYQFLTEEGLKALQQFRDDAIKIMLECENIHQFNVRFYEECSSPFQLDMFQPNK